MKKRYCIIKPVHFVNIRCLILIWCIKTGVNNTDSVDSVQNFSDDDKRLSKDSLCSDSQSDCSTNSKDVFRSITSRYLSRVHSVADPPLVSESVVDQAFFRVNSITEPSSDFDETSPETFKLELENVTTDETNDEGSQKNTSLSDNMEEPRKILAEVVLTPFDDKELTRQDAVDFSVEKIKRQDALEFEEAKVPDDTDLIDLSSAKLVSKSESSNIVKPRSRTIFSRNLSGLYNGKPKSYSMENLNTNHEFKDVLKEAISIEFLGQDNNISYSDMSLFTDGSDSVFSSPLNKNNNEMNTIFKTLSQPSLGSTTSDKIIDKNIPVVKAESILPYPYPNDIEPVSALGLTENEVKDRAISVTPPEIQIDRDIKRANEELKTSFRAAIQRITGGFTKRSPTNSIKDTKEVSKNVEDAVQKPIAKVVDSNIDEVSESNLQKQKDNDQEIVPKIKNVIPKIEIEEKFVNDDKTASEIKSTNPFNVSSNKSDKECDPEIPIDDNVSYHLKINSLNDVTEPNVSPVAIARRDVTNVNQNRSGHRLKTFMTPIKIVNGQGIIDRTSPIIPVLIQPIFFKPPQQDKIEAKPEIKPRATVYYNDMDQVIAGDNKQANATTKFLEALKFDDTKDKSLLVEKKGIYQKNFKAKQLPFLSWKTFGANDNVPDSKSPSPSKLKPTDPVNPGVVKLSKTPVWLIDNQYYQPMENVPFFINTNQSFTMPKVTEETKLKEDIHIPTTNPFLPLISNSRRESEQENYYEEIGEPNFPTLPPAENKNVADDDKISKKSQPSTDEFASITREEILKVPRRVKKPRRDSYYEATKQPEDNSKIVKEMAIITKSVISLSRTPSAKDAPKKPTGSIGEIVQNLERKPPSAELRKSLEVPTRKLSLQTQQTPSIDSNTGSWPREPKPYWKTLEHKKRLSHPIRSLNDPPPPRPLRKLAGFL